MDKLKEIFEGKEQKRRKEAFEKEYKNYSPPLPGSNDPSGYSTEVEDDEGFKEVGGPDYGDV